MTAAYTLSDRDFPREFSRFANFVGPAELQEAVNRVSTKLGPLPSSMLALYLDRYFFHTECIALSEGPNPFQLDVSDPNAVRFASFIAGVNRMKASLSASGASRFKRTILGMLRPDRDIRQLEHEVRVYTHLGQKQIKTVLADLEQIGQFDMLCDADGKQFEVECKTVTENTGEQIKTDLLVGLSEMFHKTLLSVDAIAVSGIYILTLSKSPDLCGNLHLALQNALLSSSLPLSTEDFTLSFVAKPDWNDAKTAEIVIRDLEAQSHRWFGARFGNKMLGLVLRPHKPNNLSEKIVSTLKEAADQCSGARPSLLWLHLIGHREEEFLKVAEFSQSGEGAGLNAIVARVLHPQASQTDRSHVYKIRFSVEAAILAQKPVLDAERLIQRANSLNGLCYDVPNPLCRYSFDVDA